jgi:hypothetical protein
MQFRITLLDGAISSRDSDQRYLKTVSASPVAIGASLFVPASRSQNKTKQKLQQAQGLDQGSTFAAS